MIPNDKLPEEITKQIESEAKNAAIVIEWGEYDAGPASSARMAQVSRIDPIQKEFYIKGATAWAPWKVKHNELKERGKNYSHDLMDQNDALVHENQELQAACQCMADALEKIRTWNDTERHSAAWQLTHIRNFAAETLRQWKDGKKEVGDES